MTNDTLLYLSREDVEAVDLSIGEIIQALEGMFREKGAGRTQMPPKRGIYPEGDAFIHAMPAWIPTFKSAGMKWVSAFPQNREQGLPLVSGLVILNNAMTGIPIAVMDCTWMTAMRTGAATAVAAKYLARPNASSAGIIACGVQGRSNLKALSHLFDLERVKAYDLLPDIARQYAGEMSAELGIDVEVVDTPREAIRESDLVVTSSPMKKVPEPVIEPGWLEEGAFAGVVDYDSYWTAAALHEMDKLATDDVAQMAAAREQGRFRNAPEPYADLGEIVSGTRPGRQSDSERTMTINLGLALADLATAPLVCEKAREMEIGRELPL